MKLGKEIVFFVLGVEKETKGRYLAKILRTQNGISDASFEFKTRTLTIMYDPAIIDVESIKKLTYFSECVFISEESEIKKQIALLKKQNKIDTYLQLGAVIWGVVFIYAAIREILALGGSIIAYSVLLLITVAILILYFIRRKIDNAKGITVG